SGKVNNLAIALDFQSPPNLSAPVFNVPTGPFGEICVNQLADPGNLPVPVPIPALPGITGKSLETPMSPAVLQSRLDHFADWQGLYDLGKQYGLVR
ncbi:MAG: hypothetical protein ACRETM_07595, partial [Stenotrophobium sp.]